MNADLTVLGGGPVGAAMALLSSRASRDPARVVLCVPERYAAADDPRVIAVNHGSRVLLESLGAWPAGGADILDVHVSQRGRLGRTHISHADFGVPALGTVLRYVDIVEALAARVAQAGITVVAGQATVATVQAAGDPPSVDCAGRAWSTGVCIQADGGTFDRQDPQEVHRPYAQHAVLATVHASHPRPGWAWERFTREGPLALLPRPQRAGEPPSHALVWCCAPERAAMLQAMDDTAFARELNDAFGTRLGTLSAAGARAVYPLGLNAARKIVEGRRVRIGNAAQTLHPVAGQGLNLGLRDAARLAQALEPWQRDTDADPRRALDDYARARRGDRLITAGLTDFMPRIFATGVPAVEHACGLALLGLDTLPGLRGPLARHLMEGLRT